jgi:hypothetical protein
MLVPILCVTPTLMPVLPAVVHLCGTELPVVLFFLTQWLGRMQTNTADGPEDTQTVLGLRDVVAGKNHREIKKSASTQIESVSPR